MTVFASMADITVHYSKLIGTRIYNEKGNKIGRLNDFFVDYEDVYPLVLAIQLKQNRRLFYIHWKDITDFSMDKIVVSAKAAIGRSRTFPKASRAKVMNGLLSKQFEEETVEYPALGKIILDRQIVDISGKKVVRVNDIEFIKTGQHLRVTHAAIGMRSMVRRLGFEKLVDFVVGLIGPNSKYLTNDVLINWKFVHAIPDRSVQDNVKLNLTNEDLKKLHPADLADILEDLDGHGRDVIFHNLNPELAAATLSEVDHDKQASLIKDEGPEEVAKIIENMNTDDAADILSEMEDDRAFEIISKIEDDEVQEEIQELLEYQEDTAGGLMSTEVFEISPYNKKSEILKIIQETYQDLESIYDIFVIDAGQRLIGTCSLSKILIQKEDIEVGEIMSTSDIKSLTAQTPWREVAEFMSKYNLINVPIVGGKEELLGIVSVDDVLPWLLDER